LQRFPARVDQLIELLRFFGVASPDQWREAWQSVGAAFRMSPTFVAEPGAVAAWLRQGELMAGDVRCEPYDGDRFTKVLSEIRTLTPQRAEVFCRRAIKLCASAGVALVFVPPLPKIRASGATRWLSATKALVQLSLRYRTDDQLWFTFFHETFHILRHPKRRAFLEPERNAERSKDELEQEADRYAQDFLISPEPWAEFVQAGEFDDVAVCDLATRQDIAPGIVVGRLQHEGHVDYETSLNRLKRRFMWSHEVTGAN
jgi:HTH-type transcriptional regulator / antitoxin HigA